MYSLPLTSQTCPALPSAMITSWVTLPKPPPGSTPLAFSTSSRSASLWVCAGIGSSCRSSGQRYAGARLAATVGCVRLPPTLRRAGETAISRLRSVAGTVVHSQLHKKGSRHARGWGQGTRIRSADRERRDDRARTPEGQGFRALLLSQGRHVRLHGGGQGLYTFGAGVPQGRRGGDRRFPRQRR